MLLEQSITEEYQDQGYAVLPSLLNDTEVQTLRNEVDRLYEQPKEATRHHLNLYTSSNHFAKLARHPLIVEKLQQCIGLNIQLQHSKLAVKPQTPDTGAFGMHQDFAYYPHTNLDVCAVFIALDACTPENGCLYVVPGSHKWGLLNHHHEGVFAGCCMEKNTWNKHDEVALEMQSGDVSIHHGLCMHGSPVNRSGSPRRALVYSYRAADAYQMDGNIYPETGVQISGESSEFMRLDAGNYRLPIMLGSEHAETVARHQHGSLVD